VSLGDNLRGLSVLIVIQSEKSCDYSRPWTAWPVLWKAVQSFATGTFHSSMQCYIPADMNYSFW